MIKIATDSAADLNSDLYNKHNIAVMPFIVTLGENQFLDGIDITQADIFSHVAKTKQLPKTAARSFEDFYIFFKKLTEDNSQVIYISISTLISANFENASKAAKEFNNNVICIDGLALSSGTGLSVLKACDMRDNGFTMQQIADEITLTAKKVQTSFVIDTLDYLHKGGRCSGLAAFFAGALRLRPTIRMADGRMVVAKKYMGSFVKSIDKYILDTLALNPDYDDTRVFITHCSADADAIDIAYNTLEKHAKFKEIIVADAGSTITSHCGKGTLGILYINR